jgi:hypothetical protein
MSDLTGRQLGQYEVRELVRHAGMASVYKAYQPSLDRWVAIKVLARPDDSTFVARFEARRARSLASSTPTSSPSTTTASRKAISTSS